MIGWKGVQDDYWSLTGSLLTKVIKGKVDPVTGKIFNGIGEDIEVERASVDDDCRNTCSTGLHVGSRDFANTFRGNGRLMLLRFNPKDAISVPADENARKLRVCAYIVIAEETNTAKEADDSYVVNAPFIDNDLDNYQSPHWGPKRDVYGRFCK